MKTILIILLTLTSITANGGYYESVAVNNFPSFFGATQSGAWNVTILNASLSTTVTSLPSVTGTVTANLGTIAGVSTETTLSALNIKVPSGLTVTSTRLLVDGSGVTQPVSAASLPLPTGASTAANQTTLNTTASSIDTKLTTTANGLKVDGSAVTQPISGSVSVSNFPASQVVIGNKINNSAAPSTNNTGTLPAIANADTQAWTEGNQTALSVDLNGNLRVNQKPIPALGVYSAAMTTNTYAGLAANKELMSMRWGDATRLCVILKVSVNVVTTVAASAAGLTERQLVIARSWTVSDTNGTAVSFTGNNQKRRTSMGSSLVTDMRFGSAITAGTRTLDALPVSTAVAWSPVQMTGMTIGGVGGVATSAANAVAGGVGGVTLLDATNGTENPIVLAQNEGIIVRLGAAQPTGSTQQTIINVTWAEVNKY